MFSNSRTWIIAAALAVLAALAFLLSLRPQAAGPSRDPATLRAAIESAAGFLGAATLRGDDAWIATIGARRLGPEFRLWAETLQVDPAVRADLGRDPLAGGSLGAGAEGNLWNLRWLEEVALPPLPRPEPPAPQAVSTTMTVADILAILRMMAQAVACVRLGEADRQAWLAQLQAEAHGYVLTHQLIALMLGVHQGCVDPAVVAPLRADLAARLWAEHIREARPVDDLSIERLVVLCWAGACSWIEDEWVDGLLRAQKESGSWGTNIDPGVHPRVVAREEHGAAMGFAALALLWQERFADLATPVPPAPR